ncbi:MAG: prepilin-type N-terminal cleavage/methylation domain-containing protein [Vicinamibacterales bacterium]
MTSPPRARHESSSAGFSVIELLVVLAIMAVLAGMAGLQIVQAKATLQGDGAMRVVLSQMRTAREMAITERRYMEVLFIGTSAVRIVREEVPGPTTTTLMTVGIENDVEFRKVSGVPDTPDAFGNTTATYFGAATTIKFTPDGTLVDSNGNVINGSVFLAQPGAPLSARALTVLGSTGRIRAWRWDGRAWNLV